MRNVCVFCGSSSGGPNYADAARRFGTALARRRLNLVYGGGHIGLMGAVADAVLTAGGTAVGVIPRLLVEKELAHTRLTELVVVETMHQRKAVMADRADAFTALPGGFGTADELFEILTWALLGRNAKPIGVLNYLGVFRSIKLARSHGTRAASRALNTGELVLTAAGPDELIGLLEAWRPARAPGKWLDEAGR